MNFKLVKVTSYLALLALLALYLPLRSHAILHAQAAQQKGKLTNCAAFVIQYNSNLVTVA